MNKEIKYAIYDNRKSLMESILKDIVTFSLLALCIWISQGSKWWTFFMGVFFLLFIYMEMSIAMRRYNRFKTKDDLKAWVEKLPDV